MKDLKLIPSLLITLLFIAANAAGQHADAPATHDLPARDEITAARSRYSQTEGVVPAAKDGKDLAQMPRRGPGLPVPPQRGYYRGNYPTPWTGSSDPGHMLIGAGIGFGIGATLGAIGGAHTGTSGGSAIIGGSLCALMGAAIGASHSGLHSAMYRRRFYRHPWTEDDDVGTRRSPSKRTEDHAELSVPKRHVGPRPADDVP